MATTSINYGANMSITMDLSSLGTSATFVAGRESTEVDNTTNKFVDALVSGKVTVGTTPTINTNISVYVWGSDTSLTTAPIDVLDGADTGVETLTNTGVLWSLRLGGSISVAATTSNVSYSILPFSVAQLFGGNMPKFWGLFVSHNNVAALNATNANLFEYVGVKYDVA